MTAHSDLGRQYIAPLLSRFTETYPRVTPFLILSDSLTDLAESNIDVAIRYGIDPDSQLIAHKLDVLNDFKPDYRSRKQSIGADLYLAYQDR